MKYAFEFKLFCYVTTKRQRGKRDLSTATHEIKGKVGDNRKMGPVILFSVTEEKYLTTEYCDQPTIIMYSKDPCNKFLHMHKCKFISAGYGNRSSTDTQGSLCVAGGHGWHTAGHLISIGSAAALTKGPRR